MRGAQVCGEGPGRPSECLGGRRTAGRQWLGPGNTNPWVGGWGRVLPGIPTLPVPTCPHPVLPTSVHPADGCTMLDRRFEVDQGDPRGVKRARCTKDRSGHACCCVATGATLRNMLSGPSLAPAPRTIRHISVISQLYLRYP